MPFSPGKTVLFRRHSDKGCSELVCAACGPQRDGMGMVVGRCHECGGDDVRRVRVACDLVPAAEHFARNGRPAPLWPGREDELVCPGCGARSDINVIVVDDATHVDLTLIKFTADGRETWCRTDRLEPL